MNKEIKRLEIEKDLLLSIICFLGSLIALVGASINFDTVMLFFSGVLSGLGLSMIASALDRWLNDC